MTRDIKTGLVTAALIIAFSLALVLLRSSGLIAGDTHALTVRGTNMLIGLMVVGFSSPGAKQLRRLVDLESAAREQALRRFVAWTLSLGGLIYALAWLAAPFDLAFYISLAGLGGAVVLVFARCLFDRRLRSA